MQEKMGERRFGRVNWLGLSTLAEREVRRFLAIWSQTILAPLINAVLFLAVFTLAVGPSRGGVMGVSYIEFLAPGILMMTVIQNAFANTSSSLISAKVQGNIVDTLMPPLSPLEIMLGYLAGGVVRGLAVACAVLVIAALLLGQVPAHLGWVLLFAFLGSTLLGALGLLAAILAKKFDQMAVITNFVITPLSFLSGTFYALDAVPEPIRFLAHINPFFYLIDGARFGVLGTSDSSPWLGAAVSLAACLAAMALCWHWLRRGYRLKP